MSLHWSIRGIAAVALLGVSARASIAQADEAAREAAYAMTVTRIADSAIHRLDFFPTRAQLRVQMLFLGPRDTAVAVFREIGVRGAAAAQSLDEIAARFEETNVPRDLSALHVELVASLRAARSALERLSASAAACQTDPSATTRCQSPFTSASSAVTQSYARYLAVRSKIRDQILDTSTVLPEFRVAARPD